MSNSRTAREFAAHEDVLRIADAWAQRQGYRAIDESADHRLYRKGGTWLPARMLDLQKTRENVHLEAWVATSFFDRLQTLFMAPKELAIDSGGAVLTVPRGKGRSEVNDFLLELDQQPIK